MEKHEIAEILRELGIFIELVDKNPLKGLTYRKAATSIEKAENFEELLNSHQLETLPGIGKKIAALIYVFIKHGKLSYYESLKKKVPLTIYELINIPGISVQKVRILYQEFGIKNLKGLNALLQKNKIIPGFSPSFIRKLRERILEVQENGYSLLWNQAMLLAEHLKSDLLKKGDVFITGALRRKNELVYSIELLCVFEDFNKFFSHPLILKVMERKKIYVKVLLKKGVFATFYNSTPKTLAYNLLRTTGSDTHLKTLKQHALKSHIPFRSLQTLPSEEAIYKRLKLSYIPPEIREDGSEIAAAKFGKLPNLVNQKDLKGALHCHTLASDGIDTIQTLVKEAKKLGWSYMGISDHSKSLKIARGMSEATFLAQIEEIQKLNSLKTSFHIFSGVECDILKNGSLDFDDAILKKCDFVIASVHSFFNLDKKEMTKRIIKAIEHPYATIIGHIKGRLLRYRKGYEIDLPKILDACVANGKVIELNAYPNRIDMDWRHWKKAKEKGIKCCVNPDAHAANQLSFCSYGIDVARKGWLEKEDIINTYSIKELQLFFRKFKSC